MAAGRRRSLLGPEVRGAAWVAAGGRSLLGGGGSLENRDGGWLASCSLPGSGDWRVNRE